MKTKIQINQIAPNGYWTDVLKSQEPETWNYLKKHIGEFYLTECNYYDLHSPLYGIIMETLYKPSLFKTAEEALIDVLGHKTFSENRNITEIILKSISNNPEYDPSLDSDFKNCVIYDVHKEGYYINKDYIQYFVEKDLDPNFRKNISPLPLNDQRNIVQMYVNSKFSSFDKTYEFTDVQDDEVNIYFDAGNGWLITAFENNFEKRETVVISKENEVFFLHYNRDDVGAISTNFIYSL